MTQTPENLPAVHRSFTCLVAVPDELGTEADEYITAIDIKDVEATIVLLRDAAELHTLDDDSFEMAEHVNSELVKRKKNIVATAEVPLRALREAGASVRAARDEATGQIDDAIAVLSQSLLDYTDRKKAEAGAARIAAENRQRQIDEQNARQAEVRDAQQERDDDRAEHAARLEIAADLVRDAKMCGSVGVPMPDPEHYPIVKALLERGDLGLSGPGILHHRPSGIPQDPDFEDGPVARALFRTLEGVEPADLSPLPDRTDMGNGEFIEWHPGTDLVVDFDRLADALAEQAAPAPVSVHVPKSRVHGRTDRVLEVDDESVIPYRAVENGEPLTSPNRGPITRALKAGLSVPGCRLVEKRTAVTR